jgi:hypothetical protein
LFCLPARNGGVSNSGVSKFVCPTALLQEFSGFFKDGLKDIPTLETYRPDPHLIETFLNWISMGEIKPKTYSPFSLEWLFVAAQGLRSSPAFTNEILYSLFIKYHTQRITADDATLLWQSFGPESKIRRFVFEVIISQSLASFHAEESSEGGWQSVVDKAEVGLSCAAGAYFTPKFSPCQSCNAGQCTSRLTFDNAKEAPYHYSRWDEWLESVTIEACPLAITET